jgi:hypothetical protein
MTVDTATVPMHQEGVTHPAARTGMDSPQTPAKLATRIQAVDGTFRGPAPRCCAPAGGTTSTDPMLRAEPEFASGGRGSSAPDDARSTPPSAPEPDARRSREAGTHAGSPSRQTKSDCLTSPR